MRPKTLGVDVPPALLVPADEVIKRRSLLRCISPLVAPSSGRLNSALQPESEVLRTYREFDRMTGFGANGC